MTCVSVVVPCRNEAPYAARFLQMLEAQDVTGLELDILLIDGMSTDGTRAVLDDFCANRKGWQVIDNPDLYVSHGLNRAIRSARGEIVLRMDVHTEYAPDYIRQCVETLRRTGAANVGGPSRTIGGNLMGKAIAAAFHSPFACGGARFHDPSYEGPVDTVPYGCWRKSTLEALGMFDEALVRNQDDELNLRILRGGGIVWQTPLIQSWYHPRSTLRHLFQQYFQYGFWKVAVIRKHRIPASWRHLIPGLFVIAVVVLPWLALSGMLAGSHALSSGALLLWIAVLGTYILGCLAAALAQVRNCGLKVASLLPVTFAAYHFSYGSGFLVGLAYAARAPRPSAAFAKGFTNLSR